jgi:hypothetical protein
MSRITKSCLLAVSSFFIVNVIVSSKYINGGWVFFFLLSGPSIITIFIIGLYLRKETVRWTHTLALGVSSIAGIFSGLYVATAISYDFFKNSHQNQLIAEDLYISNHVLLPSQLITFIALLIFFKMINNIDNVS